MTDHAGLDVDAVLAEVRKAVAERGLPFDIAAEARLATLDLSSFRMWQDLNRNADSFLARPLVKHLVDTPTETFDDPALESFDAAEARLARRRAREARDPDPSRLHPEAGGAVGAARPHLRSAGPAGHRQVADDHQHGRRVRDLRASASCSWPRRAPPSQSCSADSTQSDWGHSPSTSTTRARTPPRCAASSSARSRPRSPATTLAMESARRRLRNARFELTQYPRAAAQARNAAGLSAYSAHDELLVLGDGPTMPIPTMVVAHRAEQVDALQELFEDLPAVDRRSRGATDHPWRLAGVGAGDPFDIEAVTAAVRGILDGVAWSALGSGRAREPRSPTSRTRHSSPPSPPQSNPTLPRWERAGRRPRTEVGRAGTPRPWPTRNAASPSGASVFAGSPPDVLDIDLRSVATQLQAATASGFLGRKGRQAAAIAPLTPPSPPPEPRAFGNRRHSERSADLIAVQDAAAQVRTFDLGTRDSPRQCPPTCSSPVRSHPCGHGLEELSTATAALRDGGEWTHRVHELAVAGVLTPYNAQLTAYAAAWQSLFAIDSSCRRPTSRPGEPATSSPRRRIASQETWRREVDYERLVLAAAVVHARAQARTAAKSPGWTQARSDILEGTTACRRRRGGARAWCRASVAERTHHRRRTRPVRRGGPRPARHVVLRGAGAGTHAVGHRWPGSAAGTKRGGGGLGERTGGLARELEKTTRKLGTRADPAQVRRRSPGAHTARAVQPVVGRRPHRARRHGVRRRHLRRGFPDHGARGGRCARPRPRRHRRR